MSRIHCYSAGNTFTGVTDTQLQCWEHIRRCHGHTATVLGTHSQVSRTHSYSAGNTFAGVTDTQLQCWEHIHRCHGLHGLIKSIPQLSSCSHSLSSCVHSLSRPINAIYRCDSLTEVCVMSPDADFWVFKIKRLKALLLSHFRLFLNKA